MTAKAEREYGLYKTSCRYRDRPQDKGFQCYKHNRTEGLRQNQDCKGKKLDYYRVSGRGKERRLYGSCRDFTATAAEEQKADHF